MIVLAGESFSQALTETLFPWQEKGASQVALVVKNLPASSGNAGDWGSISGLRKLPGVGDGNPFQHSRLENPMDRGAWRATIRGVAQNQTRLK